MGTAAPSLPRVPSVDTLAPVGGSSRWLELWSGLRRRRTAMLGLAIYLLVILCALAADLIAPHDPNQLRMSVRLQGPSTEYWLGTDELGRDVASRIIYGARVSILVGMISIGIATLIGLPLGLIAGYYGGWLDAVISRAVDALLAFPSLILALAIMSVLGPNLQNAMIAIGIIYAPAFVRLTRAGVLSVKTNEYVLAARVAGARPSYIMAQTILPNIVSPLLVQITLGFASAIIAEAALSFLGMGVQPPTASWGAMLDSGRRFLSQTIWYSSAAGAAIFLAILSLNLLGDGLRDVLDPRLRRGE
jgi:peptide/nickel transport system permease protein